MERLTRPCSLKIVSPLKSKPSRSIKKQTLPGVCPGVCRTRMPPETGMISFSLSKSLTAVRLRNGIGTSNEANTPM